MSLATRCTACGTVFRVVQDQLRVSGGWVRCGRCSEVFNAIESLVDLEGAHAGAAQGSVHGERILEDLAHVATAEQLPVAVPAPRPGSEPVPPGADVRSADDFELHADARIEPSLDDAADGEASAPAALPSGPQPDLRGGMADAAPSAGPGPERRRRRRARQEPPAFVRQADRAARWRRPHVRAALLACGVLAAGALTAQMGLVWHDLAAARWPALRPALQRLCEQAGCRIEPPRQIENLTVESSSLLRAGPPGIYRLNVLLRNRDPQVAVRTPSFELTLTDALGQVLARRVMDMGEFGVPENSLGAGTELALATTLRTSHTAVVGFTIEAFYP